MTPKQKEALLRRLSAIQSADAQPYIYAVRTGQHWDAQSEARREELRASVAPHYAAMRKYMTKTLEPHTVEWTHQEMPTIYWDKNTTHASFDGTVYPATLIPGKYSVQMRPSIRFTVTPRDIDEFTRCVAMLRRMAEAATMSGL